MVHRSIDDDGSDGFEGFDDTSRFEASLDRFRREPVVVAGAAIASLVLLVGVWWLLRPASAPVESAIPSAASVDAPPAGEPGEPGAAGSQAVASTTTALETVVAQVAGAVAHPGVYELAPGARVDDLVAAGGGYSPEADADRVNLASPVVDGERIWVPRRGEEEVPSVVAGTGGGGGGAGGSPSGPGEPAALVDVNTASPAELEALPGVGPATAAAIVAHREANGPFTAPEDLLDVRGIGEAKLEQMRPMVAV